MYATQVMPLKSCVRPAEVHDGVVVVRGAEVVGLHLVKIVQIFYFEREKKVAVTRFCGVHII